MIVNPPPTSQKSEEEKKIKKHTDAHNAHVAD
jgi:hypothetical protein